MRNERIAGIQPAEIKRQLLDGAQGYTNAASCLYEDLDSGIDLSNGLETDPDAWYRKREAKATDLTILHEPPLDDDDDFRTNIDPLETNPDERHAGTTDEQAIVRKIKSNIYGNPNINQLLKDWDIKGTDTRLKPARLLQTRGQQLQQLFRSPSLNTGDIEFLR